MRACRFCRPMAAQHGCLCRIFTSGRARSGSGDCALWKRMNVASGSHWAITTTATPGESRGMTAIEPAAVPVRRLEWQPAEVRQIVTETPRVKSLVLQLAGWRGHLPGQHVDIR